MSAMGQKPTFRTVATMSALPLIADTEPDIVFVRYVPIGDMLALTNEGFSCSSRRIRKISIAMDQHQRHGAL